MRCRRTASGIIRLLLALGLVSLPSWANAVEAHKAVMRPASTKEQSAGKAQALHTDHYQLAWILPLAGHPGAAPVACESTFYSVEQEASGTVTVFALVSHGVKWRREVKFDNAPASAISPSFPGTSTSANGAGPTYRFLTPTATVTALYVTVSDLATGHLLSLDPQTGAIHWQYDSIPSASFALTKGPMLSSPLFWRDRVIVRTHSGLTAVRATDGAELWNVPIEERFTLPTSRSLGFASDSKAFYLNSDFGTAYAFDPVTGLRLWKCDTAGLNTVVQPLFRHTAVTVAKCRPLLMGSRLIVADGQGTVSELNATDGSCLWKVKLGYVYRLAGYGNSVLIFSAEGLSQVDLRTGRLLHKRYRRGGYGEGIVSGSRVILCNNPFFGSGWEIFSLKTWETIWRNSDFAVVTAMASLHQEIYLCGVVPKAEAGSIQPPLEIRCYKPF